MLRNTLFITLFSALFILNGCGGTTSETLNDTSTQASVPVDSTQEVEKTNTIPTITSTTTKVLKTIDLLVLVDENDKNNFNGLNETKIDHFISVTNKVYENSGIDVKFNIKQIHPYSFTATTSSESLDEVFNDKDITTLTNQTKSDLVLIYRKQAQDGFCGLAYINDILEKNSGYALVGLECASTTTAHELGHSMGLTHTQRSAKYEGLFDYAHGYGVEGEFVTIMSYQSTYNTNNQMFNYSSPDLECAGFECGVDSELDNGTDAVKALKYATSIVADYN